ncbi:DUF7832 domain-containing protein [Parerythrobacter aestuarii]|uniref:DUF7832 domain-containing protein n=1 Tax=Parerythrobacter aestuarii TaxID=3020909 RepID=UPI0024DEC08A|nr:hypothetical protein [Parerythrobacter aestuarii]
MKYDDASWHYGGQFPADLPQVAGATHIGMYLAWAIMAGLGVDPVDEVDAEELKELSRYAITPGRWFHEKRDGIFSSGDLNAEGQAFTRAYYANEKGPLEGPNTYFADYNDVFQTNETYRVTDRWSNFYHLRARLDPRLAMWRQLGRPWIKDGESITVGGKTYPPPE